MLDQKIVLVVNTAWQPIGYSTPRKALVAMCSTADGENMAAKAIRIEYATKDSGELDFDSVIETTPMFFEEWMNLGPRTNNGELIDNIVRTAKMTLRVPTVLLAHNFSKNVLLELRPTKRNIMERDGYRCQYTNKVLPKSRLNIDHVVPIDKGGKNTWENMVTCDKEINSKKGNRLNSEVGLRLIKKPARPLPVPAGTLIREARHVDWRIFLLK